MKKIFLSFFVFCASIVCGQTYQIPNATQQPAWVFPIWFEDANGKKDTLYYGYDPTADSTLCCHGSFEYRKEDTNFGEAWDSTFIVDSTFIFFDNKNLVSNFNITRVQVNSEELWFWLYFNRARTPFKLKWDAHLLYSDTLPYPSTLGTPVAQGQLSFPELWYREPPNGWSGPDMSLLITDAPLTNSMTVSDSAVFYGQQQDTSYYDGYFTIRIDKYTGIFALSINATEKNTENWQVYPNPFTSHIEISSDKSRDLELKLFDTYGKLIETIPLQGITQTLNTENLPRGIYYVSDKQGNAKRLIKL
ncbi:MAG TPA: T9SS type A sorting domain-containing protein [Chitinophagales bacterium]|nr:T9SS type A sorting domain-containing protein [Chitinophagales bacterium]